jgi:hypothetical protein
MKKWSAALGKLIREAALLLCVMGSVENRNVSLAYQLGYPHMGNHKGSCQEYRHNGFIRPFSTLIATPF